MRPPGRPALTPEQLAEREARRQDDASLVAAAALTLGSRRAVAELLGVHRSRVDVVAEVRGTLTDDQRRALREVVP